MKIVQLALAIFFSAQIVGITPALADCPHPKPPGAVPNGSTASASDMEAAKAALERFQKAAKEYLKCSEQEANARIAEFGSNVEGIRQVKLLASKRSKEIEDDLQARADELNDQLRAFKLINRE